LGPLQAIISLQNSFPVQPTDPLLSYRVGPHLYIISHGISNHNLKN
jgi:hypothetical protein